MLQPLTGAVSLMKRSTANFSLGSSREMRLPGRLACEGRCWYESEGGDTKAPR